MLVKENEKIEIYLLKIEIENTGHITNTYVVKEKTTNKLLVIDPAYDGESILKELEKIGGNLETVIITHSHADHIAGLGRLVNGKHIKVYIHKEDDEGLYNPSLNEEAIVKTKVGFIEKENVIMVEDGDKVQLGNTTFKVMHTPGHTKGSIVIYNKEQNILFSGDTIFSNSYGRTDLVTSKPELMKDTLDQIFNEFENIQVFSGHGEIFELEKAKRRIKLLFAFKEGR